MAILKNKKILITGGTGSLGREIAEILGRDNELVIYSRNEERQYLMQKDFESLGKISYYIGDVRDTDSLRYAMTGCDYAIHAAAMKDLIMCERQATQTVLNNIVGSQSFIRAVELSSVERAVAVSTDKAASPSNVYGCSKYIMEKLFEEAGLHSNKHFSSVRFGNMIDSTGSLVTHWRDNPKLQVKLTHKDVSRFFFTRKDGVEAVVKTLLEAKSGETYIKEMKAAKIFDILSIIQDKEDFEIMGLFPGEKIHEDLLGASESRNCFYENGYYIIRPNKINPTPPNVHNTMTAKYFDKEELRSLIFGVL